MYHSHIFTAALLSAGVLAETAVSPTVVIDAGTIVGTNVLLPSSTVAVNKFLGIPYAQPPINENRFLPPKPVTQFTESPLIAKSWGYKCLEVLGNSNGSPESEDCLFLNVYTPAGVKCSTAGRPVLVWIHGGWLRSGTASQPAFDGSVFAAEQGVVVVTFNYRLNVFGFPNSPQLSLEQQNLGFLDQRLALEWVQSNIRAFGGDPSKVTIAGESSGGSSVDRLVTTIHSKPPFRAAACSSGQATVSAIGRDAGPLSWTALVSLLGCNEEDEIECVRGIDAETIRRLAVANNLDFSPVNDNITQKELPYLPTRAAGGVAPVPLLIGTTGQEGTYLAPMYNLNVSTVTEEMLPQFLSGLTGGDIELVGGIMQVIQLIQRSTGLSVFHSAATVYTEVIYQCPALLVSRASSQSEIPTWRYFYNASFPNLAAEGYTSEELGASHGSDTSMILGTYPREGATTWQVELSRQVQRLWGNFVKDPSGAGPGWNRVDAGGNNIACVGCAAGEKPIILESATIDSRCAIYEPFFGRVKTPFV